MESRAIAKAPEGEGCPRCGGFVYMAEQMLAKGRVSGDFIISIGVFLLYVHEIAILITIHVGCVVHRLIDTVFSMYRDTTENVSTVFRVTKLWIQCCTVTGPITKCTVEVNGNE